MKKLVAPALVGALVLTLATGAMAQTIEVCPPASVIAEARTDWGLAPAPPVNFVLQQFDPSLGDLTSAVFTFSGNVRTNFEAEHRDPNSGATLTATSQASITATLPGGNLVIPATGSEVFNATAYDGVLDFGGTSGFTRTVMGSGSGTQTVTNAGLLAGLTGMGTYSLPVWAVGQSAVTGSGNLTASVNTFAGATLEVCYYYTPRQQVPEPGAMATVGLGLLSGLVLLRRRRA